MVLSPRELPGFFTIRGIKLPTGIVGQSGENADPMASGDQSATNFQNSDAADLGLWREILR